MPVVDVVVVVVVANVATHQNDLFSVYLHYKQHFSSCLFAAFVVATITTTITRETATTTTIYFPFMLLAWSALDKVLYLI